MLITKTDTPQGSSSASGSKCYSVSLLQAPHILNSVGTSLRFAQQTLSSQMVKINTINKTLIVSRVVVIYIHKSSCIPGNLEISFGYLVKLNTFII